MANERENSLSKNTTFNNDHFVKYPARIGLLLIVFLVNACATMEGGNPDPLEKWNRKVYALNKGIDKAIAKPMTQGYKAITPDFIEKGISNLFSNLLDIPNSVNNLLQGKLGQSFSDISRFLVNSTIGIGGVMDPASSMGLEKHDEDFGQTLAVWGVNKGPYIMLPLLGPSTLRDSVAYPVNSYLAPLKQIKHIPTRNQANLIALIDKRSGLLAIEGQLESATDEYAFVRDVYLQNRKYKVYDGDIPLDEDFECEEEDEEDCEF